MTYSIEYALQLGLEVTDNQRLAASFLDSMGLRFMIDYGLYNCERIAGELMLCDELGLPPSYITVCKESNRVLEELRRDLRERIFAEHGSAGAWIRWLPPRNLKNRLRRRVKSRKKIRKSD